MKKKSFWTKRNIVLLVLALIIVVFGGFYLFERMFAMMPQSSISLLSEIPAAKPSDKILVISPHPDDETLACGGYIAMAEKNQAKVEILLVTDGNRRGIGPTRMKEFVAATSTLGVPDSNLKYLNQPEYYLKEKVPEAKLQVLISAQITAFNPNIIFYPSPDDQNPDHKYIGQSVETILKNRQNITAYSYLVHYKYFPQPVGQHTDKNLTPPVKLVGFGQNWQKFNISSSAESQKLSALELYKSQLRTPLLHDLMVSMVRKNELFTSYLY